MNVAPRIDEQRHDESQRQRSIHAVAIELHDVAPSTWPHCQRLLDMLERIGATPLVLLIVPFYHRSVRLTDAPWFVDAIDERITRGDERVMHGFVHVDEAPPPHTVRSLIERRLSTRREGEFAANASDDARERLERALSIWRTIGWPVGGFVPPAWLLGDDARAAIAQLAPFRYVGLRRSLVTLPAWRSIATDVMWYSPTSPLRRSMSRALLTLAAARASPKRLLRIALHPRDAEFPGVIEHWRRIIEHALLQRTPTTLAAVVDACGKGARIAMNASDPGDAVALTRDNVGASARVSVRS